MSPDNNQDHKEIESSRKRMTIFRAKDGIPTHGMMPMVGMDDPLLRENSTKMMALGAGAGVGEKSVCVFREPSEKGLSVVYAWFKSNYVLIKHSHNADCVYYILSGELHAGAAVLMPGDGIFVPCDHPYTFTAGPEGVELLEFRNATQFNIHIKGNDQAHFEKMAESYVANMANWKLETTPPSQRKTS